MAISFINNTSVVGGTGNITTVAINTTGADFLVANVAYDFGGTAPTVSDSKTNSWNPLTASNSGNTTNKLYYCIPTSVGTGHTFTASNGGNQFATMEIQAFSGLNQTSPFESENGNANSSGTIQPGSVTPSINGALIITGAGWNVACTPTSINSSFIKTDEQNFGAGNNYGSSMAYLIQSTVAAVNPTWTRTGSAENSSRIAVFRGLTPITVGTVVGSQASGGDITTSLTITQGQTAVIAIATAQDSNTNNIQLASIIRNSQSFTKISGYGGSGGTGQPCYAEAWYLLNPTVGTSNSVADFSASMNNCSITYYPLIGANLSNLINKETGESSSGTPSDLSLSTNRDNCLLIGALVMEQTINSVDAPSTSDASYVDQSFENTRVARQYTSVAGSYTMGFNPAAGGAYAEILIAVNSAYYTGNMLLMFK